MARPKSVPDLSQVIQDMRAQRQELLRKIEEIDRVFAANGIAVEPAPGAAPVRRRPGRPPAAEKAAEAASTAGRRGGKRGRRGRFAISGEQSVLDFVRSHGRPSTKEVNQHWQQEGRGGKADNTLTKLVKDGKLNRVEDPGVRGSRYTVA